MFFEPVEVSLIQENKIVSSDQNILKTKITNLEKKVDLFNTDIVRFAAIANKKTG